MGIVCVIGAVLRFVSETNLPLRLVGQAHWEPERESFGIDEH